jgi:hypothetical protein
MKYPVLGSLAEPLSLEVSFNPDRSKPGEGVSSFWTLILEVPAPDPSPLLRAAAFGRVTLGAWTPLGALIDLCFAFTAMAAFALAENSSTQPAINPIILKKRIVRFIFPYLRNRSYFIARRQ